MASPYVGRRRADEEKGEVAYKPHHGDLHYIQEITSLQFFPKLPKEKETTF